MHRHEPAPPLTHHEILGLVEPFTRRGRHVDLAASDRTARMLVFKPPTPTAKPPAPPALRETLRMACAEPGHFVLTRTLVHPADVQATLRIEGPQPAALLEQLDRVAPSQQFTDGRGYTIARSHAIDLREGERPAPPPILVQGVVQADGLTLTLDVGPVTGIAADVTLRPAPGTAADLPEDLLAVLGWDWTRLVRGESGWSSKLRLRGSRPRRSRTAEAALDRAARHLAQVLAEAPARFHQRHRAARWGAMFRRSIPSLTAVSMIGAAALMPHVADRDQAGILLALHYAPIAALALAFSLQELAQFEIPKLPRRPKAARWLEPLAADAPRGP